ncbi:MAG: MFS transporter [Helicobacteraceae bacterium]
MKEIKLLMLINMLCSSAVMVFVAIIAPIIRELSMQEWHAGLTVSLAGVFWVLLSRFWGRKSDIIGRKKILMVGVFGVGIFYLLLAIYVNLALEISFGVLVSLLVLVTTRTMIGAFYAAITPVSNALIADKVEPAKRTPYIAKLGAANGIGMVLGPTIGALLAGFGLAAPLYVFAVLPFLGLFALWAFLDDEKSTASEQDLPIKIFDARLRLPMLTIFIAMVAVMSSQVNMGFYAMDRLGLSTLEAAKLTGYGLAAVSGVFIVSQIFVSKIQASPTALLRWGAALGVLDYTLVCLMNSEFVLILGFCIGGFGLGLIFPSANVMAVNFVNKHEQGMAAGTVSAAQGLGSAIAPIASTAIYAASPVLPFVIVVVGFAVVIVASALLKERGKVRSWGA